MKQEKEIKIVNLGKKETKLLLFAENMILFT